MGYHLAVHLDYFLDGPLYHVARWSSALVHVEARASSRSLPTQTIACTHAAVLTASRRKDNGRRNKSSRTSVLLGAFEGSRKTVPQYSCRSYVPVTCTATSGYSSIHTF